MTNSKLRIAAILVSIIVAPAVARSDTEGPVFPVEPILFADDPFRGWEGNSSNGEGRLFATCNQASLKIAPTVR